MKRIGLAMVAVALLVLTGLASADTYGTNFESFTLGTVDGKDGWINGGSRFNPSPSDVIDAEIVSNGLYPSFATRQMRMSNSTANTGFGNWVGSRTLAQPAGQTGASDGNTTAGPWAPFFVASWDFASTNQSAQQTDTTSPGCSVPVPCPLQLFASPIRHLDFSRTNFLKMRDRADGLAVIFDDYESGISGNACVNENFVGTIVASGLDRHVPHNLMLTIHYVDGPDNDIVRVYVDGVLRHTGRSWEGAHTDCGDVDTGEAIDRILFYERTSSSCILTGTAAGDCGGKAPTLEGGGFLIDNFNIRSGAVPVAATVSKAFSPATVVVGQTSTMRFTVANPNALDDLNGVGFTDDFSVSAPGVTIKSPPNTTVACGNPGSSGALTAVPAATSVSLSNAFIKAGDSCVFTVDVSSSTAGSKTNATSAIVSLEGGTGLASNTATLTVNQAATTTSILSHNPSPSVVGQPYNVVWSVPVTPPGSGTPTGTVSVTIDGAPGCSAAVSAGQCAVTSNTIGAKSLIATYSGDANFSGSASAPASHTVNSAGSTTAITAHAPSPSVVGQAYNVQWTLTVMAPGSGTPTGTVTVTVDGGPGCSAPASTGQCAITSTTAGVKSLVATYSGDANFAGSTSPAVNHTVNSAGSATTITAHAPNPSTAGQAYNVQWTLTVTPPGSGTPTGTVTVTVDGGPGCSAPVSAGQCAVTSNTIGVKSLVATYSGDANFSGSASAPVSHTVNTQSTVTTTSPATVITTSSATLSGNVSADGGAPLTARGIVFAQNSVNPAPILGGTGVTPLTDASASLGSFSENATGLLPGTNYAFSAFATNSAGTSYGAVVIFTTATQPGGPVGGTGKGINPGGGQSAPTLTKAFDQVSIPVGGTSKLSFTVSNPNPTPLTGVGFMDVLPAGLSITAGSVVTGSCGGGIIVIQPASVTLAGATLPAGGSCTFSVSVTGTVAGDFSNSVSANANGTGFGAPATANLHVGPLPPKKGI